LIIELHRIERGVWRAVNPATGVPLHGLTFQSAEEAGRLVTEILKPDYRRVSAWDAIPARKPASMAARAGVREAAA
jgi:hypothetical protein